MFLSELADRFAARLKIDYVILKAVDCIESRVCDIAVSSTLHGDFRPTLVQAMRRPRPPVGLGGGIMGLVAFNGRPATVRASECLQDSLLFCLMRETNIKALAIMPSCFGGKVVGLVVVGLDGLEHPQGTLSTEQADGVCVLARVVAPLFAGLQLSREHAQTAFLPQ